MAGINFDFSTGVLPAGITFTRASIGTYNSSGNILTTASSNVARFNYVSGVANLLIEPAATNLLTDSNGFGNTGSWGISGTGTVTPASFVSPDGTNNGFAVAITGGNGGIYQPFTYAAIQYTMSMWVKNLVNAAPTRLVLAGGTIGGPFSTPSITRLSFSSVVPAVNDITLFQIFAAGSNTNGFYGAQLETGSTPTSYIPTTTAAVTRQADSATFTVPAGINQLVYTFDDNSTQTVAVSPGSYTIPTTLNRPNIKSVVGRYAFDFTGGSLPAGMTFTRPSIGTYNSSGNILTTAGNDVARFNYVGGAANLLIEPSATNMVTQSNSFTTDWATLNGAVLTAAQFISPDGANNGWSMTSGTGNSFVYTSATYLNIQYTLSLWAKQITGSAATQLSMNDKSSGNITTTATITRLTFSAVPTAGVGAGVYIQVMAASGSTNGIYGCQLETGSKATSYIPTTTAPVTRAADAAVLTIPAGVNALLYTFDDGSTQQVSVTPGSYTIPVNLSRPNIKSIQGLSGFDFTSGTLPPGITFTRASIGTYFDSGNILRTASNNVARMNYVSGVSCLLIEGSATNLFLQSNAFTTAPWTNASAAINAAQFTSPDGTNNGWSIVSGGSGVTGVYQNTTFSATPYTVSAWAKLISGTVPITFQLFDRVSSPATTTTLTRLSGTITPPAISDISYVYINAVAAGNADGLYGVQLELGSKLTSYIPTTTTAATRAADSATFTIPTGVTQLTYTFDDNSTQTVSATAGSYTIPTNLNRPNIKSIAWISQAAITPTPSPARVGAFQSFGLAAGTPLQLTAGGTYRLYILNTGPGNLFVSTSNTPGPNAATMLIPPLKAAPFTTTAGAIWLSSDQDSTVSIAAMPR